MRQRRRKALAAIAILLGTTAVTAMLALATTIGDRIHRELAVYGANIVVYPKADTLDVKVGGVELKLATGGAYLKESDLEKLKGIFWANNITGVSPELIASRSYYIVQGGRSTSVKLVGAWFNHKFGSVQTGAPELHPWWKIDGSWPSLDQPTHSIGVVLGSRLAGRLGLHVGSAVLLETGPSALIGTDSSANAHVVGIVSTGDDTEDQILVPLSTLQTEEAPDALSRVEIAAKTRPEDAFARMDPEKLSPKQHDLWYCRPYANSIAYQIMEAIPGSQAEQVRRVEQSEGTVLSRISGLMWLVSGAALLAAGFAVSAAMATAVLERRGEIGLMRSLGASKGAIAGLFYAESGLLAVGAGVLGYGAGSVLAWWLGRRIFPGNGAGAVLNWALLPVVVGLALAVAVLGSTPSIRAALRTEPSSVLRGDA